MATPRYVVQKRGDEYVTVPAENYPQMDKATYTIWGSLFALFGLRHRGLIGLALAGLGGWMAWTALQGRKPSLSDLFGRLTGGGLDFGNRGPAYQRDYRSRATQSPADDV